ncbi:MAG: hypothetical protein M9924_05810 [Rhizobiaceae bacterium]|nr:hypothetical protein [Rhizobiaceae bacterium]
MLASPDFDTTERVHRFLSYVVEETLSGRGTRIKAYSVAIEVFGRDASFDPESDPVVRIEAGHLRRALERYYLTAGRADPILITISKGGYVPTFSRQSHEVRPAIPPAPSVTTGPNSGSTLALAAASALVAAVLLAALIVWWLPPSGTKQREPERPRLLVQSFEDLAGTDASSAFVKGLSQEIVSQLSKFKDVVVVESDDVRPDRSVTLPRFALAGSVDLAADEFRLRVRLINRDDDSILWANSYDGRMSVGELVRAQSDMARNIATTLAQAYGVISKADAALVMDNPPDDWAAYSCTLSFYAYRAEADLNQLPGVRDCLERAVAQFPNYATAWGLLSQAYIDGIRFRYPFDPHTSSKAIEMALAAAKRAVDLDPFNVRGLQAQMFALYFAKDVDAALAVGKRAMTINPNDTELMGEYGYRLAQSGNWSEGCLLIAEARDRNPGPLAYYETALALCAYFAGNYEQAAALIRRAPAVRNPNYHAIAAAIFGESGNATEAAHERAWLETNVPALIQNARQEVSFRFMRPGDVEFFLGSLKKAGLDIKD